FAERNADWVIYGEFSGFRILPGYRGPRPEDDTFVPYGGDPDRLEESRNPQHVHAFRRAMLLSGVDLPGLWGMTTAAHTEADVDRSEEHTSELQSHLNLVCRLLLEKK